MRNILSKLFDRAQSLAEFEPAAALFLAAALLAVFLTALRPPEASQAGRPAALVWSLYGHGLRLLWAGLLVAMLIGALAVLRGYLRHSLASFQGAHGRVTQANYNAVQTIWGAEQRQAGLTVMLYQDQEVVERIESEDITKPAVLRKKTVRRMATGNPFQQERHDIILRQSPRKKGSALYVGYETECRFNWQLRNPSAESFKGILTFPLPSAHGMYDELSATLNGQDILPQVQIREGALVLEREVSPNEALEFALSFKSRGMSFWYFQIGGGREIREFILTLNLPDLPPSRLNYPEGCMTPTAIRPSQQGSVLTYRLDHALSGKGMGVALPTLPQPGAVTNAVLSETERSWMLLFGALGLALTLAAYRQAVLLTTLFATATAFGYGLLGNLNDVLFGFWGTVLLVVLPIFLALAFLLTRMVHGLTGRWLAIVLVALGLIYPCLAGLDPTRQELYYNLCLVGLLVFTGTLAVHVCNMNGPKTAVDATHGFSTSNLGGTQQTRPRPGS